VARWKKKWEKGKKKHAKGKKEGEGGKDRNAGQQKAGIRCPKKVDFLKGRNRSRKKNREKEEGVEKRT